MQNTSLLLTIGLAITLTIVSSELLGIEQLERGMKLGEIPHTQQNLIRLFKKHKPHLTPQSKEYSIFKQKLGQAAKHNSNADRTWTAGINKFTFMDNSEIRQKYMGSQNCSATAQATLEKRAQKGSSSSSSSSSSTSYKNLGIAPLSIDWRDKGIVSAVKDQDGCGSCWTYATTGALESHWAIQFGITPNMLSTQQLVDCAGDYNNFGCNGGLPSQAFQYIRYNGGISSESAYPYLAIDSKCQYNPLNAAAYVPGGSVNITAYDELQLQDAVGLVGPVAVAFEVTDDFFSYESGVYINPKCDTTPDKVNHAVLAVGYGNDGQNNFWLIQNSWSKDWGMQGYFMMERGQNMCGVSDCASYPDLTSIQ